MRNRISRQANWSVEGDLYIRKFYNGYCRYIVFTGFPAQLRQIFPPYVFNQPNLTNSNYLNGAPLYGSDGSLILDRDNFGVDMQSRLDQPYKADNYKRFW